MSVLNKIITYLLTYLLTTTVLSLNYQNALVFYSISLSKHPIRLRAVPEIILGGGNFLTTPSSGHAESHKRPPQDKSEYQLRIIFT